MEDTLDAALAPAPPKVQAELSKDKKTVLVRFDYDPSYIVKVKKVPGRRFVGKDKPGGPAWRLDKDLTSMRRLREQFKDELSLGPKLRKWGREEVEAEARLRERSQANDAELAHVPKSLVAGDGFTLRPYQKADIAFMAEGRYINANKPGSGKTAEIIGSVFEAELEWGMHLVSAPLISLEDVWEKELKDMYAQAGYDEPTILTGNTTRARKAALQEAKELADEGYAFWLVVNPEMLRMKKEMNDEAREKMAKDQFYEVTEDDYEEELIFPEFAEIEWDSFHIDEFHLARLGNPATQFYAGANEIAQETQPAIRGCASGTPMGGKPIKLWGALHFVHPEKFPARWRWARQWLSVTDKGSGKKIGGLTEGREEEFYDHLKPYLIRRTKAEVLPGLPPKNRIPVWCHMTPKQKEQYKTFEAEAELRIEGAEEEGRLSAPNVLAEYTRLKQFAAGFCNVRFTGREVNGMPEIKVETTLDGGKFLHLEEKLREENVIVAGEDDDDPPECALIFSQHNATVEAAKALCDKHKVPAAMIMGVGKTKDRDRKAAAKAFQTQSVDFLKDIKRPSKTMLELLAKGPPRVLIIGTRAGSTALNLSMANSVHMLDETWDPDDTEQGEDRAHRGDELTEAKDELRIYIYRTKGSIDEYVKQVNVDKDLNNKTILDLIRQMQEARAEEAAEEAVAA